MFIFGLSNQTHSGSVWRVTWAHPEFGQVLATCSFDRTAAVWEKEAGQNHWLKRTSLVDSRTSVTDVKFAPKHMGLQLVSTQTHGPAVGKHQNTWACSW